MKRLFTGTCYAAAIFLLVAGIAAPVAGQTIKVTFLLNTSTNPDTLRPNHFVQIRGALNGKEGAVLPGGKTINWGSTSGLILTNTGGDYWKITFDMNPDDTLRYKFWAGFASDKGTVSDWESGVNPVPSLPGDPNRAFVSGNKDTTVALQFFNGTGQTQDQLWRPFQSKPDSVAIYFRVNMGGVTQSGRFNPATNGPVGIRGDDVNSGKTLDWGATKVVLARETGSVDKGSFWSGVAYFPKSALAAGKNQDYKFYINNATGDAWEGGNNRNFKYPVGLNDTTLAWDYFDHLKPRSETPVQSTITFRMNLKSMEGVGLFDRSKGDKVAVIGAKGWDRPSNYINMAFNSLLQEWTVAEPFNVIPGDAIPYKYFLIWDSSRVKVGNPNYIPLLTLDDGWEEPGVRGGGNRLHIYQNSAQQTIIGDFGRAQQFFDSVLPEGVIRTAITVTWNINMKPATDRATNPDFTLFRLGVDSAFIQLDTPLFAITQGKRPGAQGRYLLKDPDGDGIYSGTYDLKTPTWFQVPFRVAYTTPGGIVENGGGTEPGRRYYQFIKPASISSSGPTWPATYNFPTLDWRPGKDLPYETPPALVTAVAENPTTGVPQSFVLEQNYPNPFNPVTKIDYQVAKTTEVKIGVYNLMGQLVKTLVNEKLNPGKYATIWAGDNAQGKPVGTGVYFLKMQAGEFTKVHKMALVR